MDGNLIRVGISLVGILLMVVSFLMHSYKKITVNYTVIWELMGFVLILIGVVPVFSQWTKLLGSGTGLAFFGVGAIFLFEEFRTSTMISQLILKEREMAMHVALLNQENEAILKELDRLNRMVREEQSEKGDEESKEYIGAESDKENVGCEKDFVCSEYIGESRCGNSAT